MPSELEAIREFNLKKNVEFLSSIGLGPGQSPLASFARSNSNGNGSGGGKKSKRTGGGGVSMAKIADGDYEPRRSSRIRNVDALNYDESAIDIIERWEERSSNKGGGGGVISRLNKRSRVVNEISSVNNVGDEDGNNKLAGGRGSAFASLRVKREPAPIDPRSSRACICDFSQFSDSNKLGVELDEHGKAYVMSLAYGGKVPKFSKYSGVVEWSNCVFLWVNIGDIKYSNVFSQGGELMVWFGGSLMTDESPVTQRLLAKSDPVILFVRLSASDPYVSLGQVEVSAFNVSVHPVEITWRLLSFKQLKSTAIFRSINNAA